MYIHIGYYLEVHKTRSVTNCVEASLVGIGMIR